MRLLAVVLGLVIMNDTSCVDVDWYGGGGEKFSLERLG